MDGAQKVVVVSSLCGDDGGGGDTDGDRPRLELMQKKTWSPVGLRLLCLRAGIA